MVTKKNGPPFQMTGNIDYIDKAAFNSRRRMAGGNLFGNSAPKFWRPAVFTQIVAEAIADPDPERWRLKIVRAFELAMSGRGVEIQQRKARE
jgi:hypothetical protein